MTEAAAHRAVELEQVSFKGALDAVRQYGAAIAQARNRKMRRQLWEDLLLNLARDLVPLRPNRREPRAFKRPPKSCPLLNQPRRRFVEISHRTRYWKGRHRNYGGLNQGPFGTGLFLSKGSTNSSPSDCSLRLKIHGPLRFRFLSIIA